MSVTEDSNEIFGDDDETPKPETKESSNESKAEKNAEAMAEDAPEPDQKSVSESLDKDPEQPEDERKLDEFFQEMSKDQIFHFIGDRLDNEDYGEFQGRRVFLEACLKAEKMTQDREDVKEFIQKRAEKEDTDATQRPVFSNNDDQAAWINTDKNGNEYLSVKAGKDEDGEPVYANLFPQTDLMRLALKQQHEVNKSK